ncbi:MAG TPA: hypothetical protein ENH28_00330 [Euryarchaeota archaeon]|nr:hypothetical protein [Euryarchaeota archaeon]
MEKKKKVVNFYGLTFCRKCSTRLKLTKKRSALGDYVPVLDQYVVEYLKYKDMAPTKTQIARLKAMGALCMIMKKEVAIALMVYNSMMGTENRYIDLMTGFLATRAFLLNNPSIKSVFMQDKVFVQDKSSAETSYAVFQSPDFEFLIKLAERVFKDISLTLMFKLGFSDYVFDEGTGEYRLEHNKWFKGRYEDWEAFKGSGDFKKYVMALFNFIHDLLDDFLRFTGTDEEYITRLNELVER